MQLIIQVLILIYKNYNISWSKKKETTANKHKIKNKAFDIVILIVIITIIIIIIIIIIIQFFIIYVLNQQP
jgi:Na+/melibiose symporter-like transporter